MYNFYKGNNNKEILQLMLKKIREQDLTALVLFPRDDILSEISKSMWAPYLCVCHGSDPNLETLENVFFSTKINVNSLKDVLIIFENADVDGKLDLYKKIVFIGNYYSDYDGLFWNYDEKKWIKQTKEEFFKN